MIGLLTMWVVISALFVLGRYIADGGRILEKGRIKTNLNAVALTLNIYEYLTGMDYQELITPKTPIQKGIKEKRKEIEKLKKQKADMEELDRLKIEESELFWEVNDPGESTGPHFKWCAVCHGHYLDGHCDCLEKAGHAVDPLQDKGFMKAREDFDQSFEKYIPEGRLYKLIYNGHEVPFRFRTEQEAHNYAKAISTSNWYIAEVERIDV